MITIVFHPEPVDGELTVWADSPDLPGFSAAGGSIIEVRGLVKQYLSAEAIEGDLRERVLDSEVDECVVAFLSVDGKTKPMPGPSELKQAPPLDDATYDFLDA